MERSRANWKENVEREFRGDCRDGFQAGLVTFIQTEIIEKLIADVPTNAWMHDDTTTVQEFLKTKWLGEDAVKTFKGGADA